MKYGIFSRNLFLILIFGSFLVACSPPTSDLQVVETENKQEVTTEIVHINNCGGMANTEQTVTHSFSTSIGGGITAKLGIKIVAEGGVSAKYEEARNTMKSIKLAAPPGTNMEFTLQWTEQTWIGRVMANGETGDYTARVPISVAQVDAKDIGCPITPTATTPSIPLVLDVRPACGDTYTVEAERSFDLRYGTWYARGIEKAIDNSDHLAVTLTIDGQIIPGTKQPVEPVNSSWPGAACGGSVDFEEGFGLFYIAGINPLSAGEHSVQISYTLDTQVTDGYTDNNNNPNTYGPGQFNTLNFIIVAK